MSLRIRSLAASDREGWDPLWRGYLAHYREDLPAEVTERSFARLAAGADASWGHVAVGDGGVLVGLAHALLHASSWSIGGYAFLEDLYVAPPARGGDVGRALIAAVADEARRRGATKLYWQTQAYNGRARSLYDQVGDLSSSVLYERELVEP